MVGDTILKKKRITIGILSLVVCLSGYFWMSHRQHQINKKDTTIPTLSQFVEGIEKITTKDAAGNVWIIDDTIATGSRLLYGFVVGVVIFTILGVLMGCYQPLSAFFLPPINFLSKIPPTAMLAVYFVLFGFETQLFVAMIALGIGPTLAMAVYDSVNKDVADHDIYKAYTLGASHMEVVFEVVFRQILPRIIQNIQLQIGPAMVFLIAAEWMVADIGFGYRLRIQSRLLNMNVVYLYLFGLGAGGFVFNWACVFSRRKLCKWFGE
jgi:ABC-type nitrate/sulfonate/bicarbonate transport system permease component